MQRKRRFKKLIKHQYSPESYNLIRSKYLESYHQTDNSDTFPLRRTCKNLLILSNELKSMVENECANEDDYCSEEKSDLFVNIDRISKDLLNLSKKYYDFKLQMEIQENIGK